MSVIPGLRVTGSGEETKYPRAEIGCVWVDLLHQAAVCCLEQQDPEAMETLQTIMKGTFELQGLVQSASIGDFPQLQKAMESGKEKIPAQTALVKLVWWAETLPSSLEEWAQQCGNQSVSSGDEAVDPLTTWLKNGLKLVIIETAAVMQQSMAQFSSTIEDRLLDVKVAVKKSLDLNEKCAAHQITDSLTKMDQWISGFNAVAESIMKALGGEACLNDNWQLRALIPEHDITSIRNERPGLFTLLDKASGVLDALCSIENSGACLDGISVVNDRFVDVITKCGIFSKLGQADDVAHLSDQLNKLIKDSEDSDLKQVPLEFCS